MMIFYCTVCNKLPGHGHGHPDPVPNPKKKTDGQPASGGKSGDLETGGGDSFFTPVRYHKWISHLTSDAHQEKVWARWGSFVKQNRRMPLDQDRFVVVGLNRGLDHYGLQKIGAWLSEFGVVTELIYMKEEGVAIVTLMGVGYGFDCRNSEARKESFANEVTDPKGYPISVYPRIKVLEDGFLWYTISTGLLKRELENKVRELLRSGVRFGRQRDQLEENKKEGEGAVEGKGEVAGFSGGGFKAGGKENRVVKKEEVVVKNEGTAEGKKGKKNNNKRKKGKMGWEEGTGSKFGGEAGKVVEIDKIWTGMTGKKMEVPKKWKTDEELLLVPGKKEEAEKVKVGVASVQEGLGIPVEPKVGQEKELKEPEKKKEEDQTDSVKELEEPPKKSEIGKEKDVEEPEKEKEDKTAVDSLKEPETAPKKSEVGPGKKEEEIGKEKDLEEPLKKVVSTEEPEKKKEEDQTDSVKEPEEPPKKSEVGPMEEKEPQKEVETVKEPQKELESVKEPQKEVESVKEPQKEVESVKEPQKELKEPENPTGYNPMLYWSTPLPDIELPPF